MFSRANLPQRPDRSPSDLTVEVGSVMRWRAFGIWMLVVGAIVIETALAMNSVTANVPVLAHGAAVWMLVLAAILGLVQGRAYLGLTRLVIGSSILAITALVASIEGVEMVPLFYVWPLLGAAYLLSRAEVVGFVIGTVIAFAAATVVADPVGGFPAVDFVLAVIVGLLVVVVVRALAEGLGTTIDSLRVTSSTDPLTGLLNRRGFQRRFSRQYERSLHDGRPITALLIDIDHFKRVNDEFGHPVGDRALVRFTELLEASCRASDIVARVGGEEFAVVMPGATLEQAIARAEQFSAILRADRSVEGIAMTASVGVATRDDSADGWEGMLVAADAAVYEAKRTGRDRVVTADPAAARAA